MLKHIAILDIGSSSITMDVFCIQDKSYTHISHSSAVTSLSTGITRDGVITDTAIEKTAIVLQRFMNEISVHDDCDIFGVATAVFRQAKNGKDVIKTFKKILGKRAEIGIISGEKEAYYTYLGVVNNTHLTDFVILDVGGASSEITLVKNRKQAHSASLDIGSNTITEKNFPQDFVLSSNLSEAEVSVKEEFDKIPWFNECNNLPIIAVGSSFRELASVVIKKRISSEVPLQNFEVSKHDFNFVYKKIAKLPEYERITKLGINRKLAHRILGGLVPFNVLLKALGGNRIIYNESGLRVGFFNEIFSAIVGDDTPIVADVLGSSITSLQTKYNVNITHARTVNETALKIYDELFEIHKYGIKYRNILEIASQLHDIGEYISVSNHHKHSYYIIKESNIAGLSVVDKMLAASVASGHRKPKFYTRYIELRKILNKNLYNTIKNLSAILSLYEYLTKNFPNKKFEVSSNANEICITIKRKKNMNPLDVAYTTQFYKKILGRRILIT